MGEKDFLLDFQQHCMVSHSFYLDMSAISNREKRIRRERLTCETLRSSALLVFQFRLACQVERDLDVLRVVNSEYVETLTPGHLQVMKVKVRGQNT